MKKFILIGAILLLAIIIILLVINYVINYRQGTKVPKVISQVCRGSFYCDTIEKCYLEEETVFKTGSYNWNLASYIYNTNGDEIGKCLYQTGKIDEICAKLEKCLMVEKIKK